ncbi:MAG: thiamine diphosphokinase [Ruminococcus sp.]|nr:thiamine diphosphokinase [Ruminococcus sp.]
MRCVIIAGSPDTNTDFIRKTVGEDDYLICADKGLSFANKAGLKPNLVVGDFDSYKGKLPTDCEIVSLNRKKDDTDTMHAIDIAFERGHKNFLLLGATGGRIDHTIANISALMYINNKGGRGDILSHDEYIRFLPDGDYMFHGLHGLTFSVFPFGCKNVYVSISGAEYPLDNFCLTAETPLGISNVFTSDESKIKISDGNAIIIINLGEV